MALPSNNGIFIHEGLNCSPNYVPTAQSIPISTSDNTTVKSVTDTTLSNIAEDYDATSTYAVGDCVLYQRVLYQCTTAIPTAEAWNSAHWTAVKAVDVGSGGGGASSLHDLTDVDDTGKTTGDTIVYNSTASKWQAKPITITCTQAEYDTWASAVPSQIDPAVVYLITDGVPDIPDASDISYSNTTSGLSATDVQDAIDEVVGDLDDKADRVVVSEYDSTIIYAYGDIVSYEGSVYKCNHANTTGTWDSTRWDLITPNTDYLHSINPIGNGSFSLNRKSGTTVGNLSFTEGNDNEASGLASHAEGSDTKATNGYAHAEGLSTTASGATSHAEGNFTFATGDYSHAEGSASQSKGVYSHAEGFNSTANRRSQHVFGEYNVIDTTGSTVNNKGSYVEIVGNGTDLSARSNARTLDWSGNEVLSGTLKIKGTQDVGAQVVLTQAQYNALATPDPDTTYYITDGEDTVTCNLVELTQAQYDLITSPDPNTWYFITDGEEIVCDLGDLNDVSISSEASGQILAYDGSKWANSDILNTKADVIPTGSHTVYGIWGNTYYSTCRMWVAFPNANKYTITITSARYRSADTTMTTLSSASIALTNDCGFLVSSGSNVPVNQYGDVTFTTASN